MSFFKLTYRHIAVPVSPYPYRVSVIHRSQDLPIDYAGFVAIVFGVVGLMLRVRIHLLTTALLTLSDLSSISE